MSLILQEILLRRVQLGRKETSIQMMDAFLACILSVLGEYLLALSLSLSLIHIIQLMSQIYSLSLLRAFITF